VSGLAVVALLIGLAVGASGCGSSSPGATAQSDAAPIVSPPDEQLSGCSYETDGTVPVGEPQGEQPPFPKFTPDQAADAALQDIKKHGGTGIVSGFTIPSGTNLYAGPDSTGTPVATVNGGNSLFFFDPVYWRTSSGEQWLASFVACGGTNLYWAEVSQIAAADPAGGAAVSTGIKDALGNPPYTKTGEISLLPIKLDDQHTLVWSTTRTLPFPVARGEYLGY
jgi:hypothetical protein